MPGTEKHSGIRRLTASILIVFLLVIPTTVAADTATNTPQHVAVGGSAIFSGTGFNANETLSLWETAPGAGPMALPGTQTDGNGAFSISVSFPNAGQWQVTAHGLTSLKETVGTFNVGTGATTATTAPPLAATGSGMSIAAGGAAGFTGTGFNANETISIWETGPDGSATPLPSIQADANGAFSTSVTFPSPGAWQVTAQGVVSNQKTVGTFTVGGAAGATTGATSVAVNASVAFSGTGFYANEQISLWQTGPDGKVTALSGIVADGSGNFSTSVTFPTNGQWEVTARGVTSGKQSVGTYNVGMTAGATAPTTGAPAPSSPASVPNAPQIALGTAAVFSGTGFTAGENISMWQTAPDATATPLPGLTADAKGGFSASVTFPSSGYWQVTAQGRTSGHSVISGYNVTANPTSPSATTSTGSAAGTPDNALSLGAPVSVSQGSLVKFIVPGFDPNEAINAWTTAPNGIVTPVDNVQATSTGLVAVATTFSTPGLWQITARGRDSGRAVNGQYQVK